MDWSRERYVRLYTRNTGTWVLLSWQARCVLPLLMRSLDRAGRLALPGKAKPEAVIAKLLDVPVRVVKPGLEDLVAAGVIELTVSGVVMPNFAEAQECKSVAIPGAERTAEWRRRKREADDNGVTNGDASDDVTTTVTDVTPCLAVPSRTVPSLAVLTHTARERAGDAAWIEVDAICSKLPWLGEGLPKLTSPRDRIHKLVVEGITAGEVESTLTGFAAAIQAGKEPRRLWDSYYVFSGHFGRLRNEYGVGAAAVEKPNETMRERLARLQAERGEA